MTIPTLCLYVTGTPSTAAREQHGTFIDWFRRSVSRHDVELRVVHATSGAFPDDIDGLDGIVITGSPASLVEPAPWMEVSVELIRHAYHARIPLLGVCFGHQLIGAAFGGSVMRNPAGWHVATQPVELTPRGIDDPLFDGVPASFHSHFSHEDIVDADTLSPMNGITVLARSRKAPVAAVAAGAVIRGVQFHPEFTAEINRTYVALRRDVLARQAEDRGAPDEHPDALLCAVRDTPDAERVLANFVQHFARPRRAQR